MRIPDTLYVQPGFPTRHGCYFRCSIVKKPGYLKMMAKPKIFMNDEPYWLCFDLVNGDAYETCKSQHNYVWVHYSQSEANRRYQKHAKNSKYAALSTPKGYYLVE